MNRVCGSILIFFLIKISLSSANEEKKASKVIESELEHLKFSLNEANIASWNHAVNVTDENQNLKTAAQEKLAKFSKQLGLKVKEFNYKAFKNETLKRLIKNLANIGDAILVPEDFRALQNHIAEMQSRYAKAKVPSYNNKNQLFSLEPEITTVLETSRDPDELKYYWTQWYDLAGLPCKENFFKYAELRNKAAKLNGTCWLITKINLT
jgi:peptidyl-dipeptidase A